MVKKIVALTGAGAVLLSLAVPVFGWTPRKDIAIIENNEISASANTGMNSQDVTAKAQKGGDVYANGTRTISTGNAHAKAKGVIVANTHVGCGPFGGEPRHKDVAVVKNNVVYADANTGLNWQDVTAKAQKGGEVNASGTRTISTGHAWAKAKGYVVVNTHLSL